MVKCYFSKTTKKDASVSIVLLKLLLRKHVIGSAVVVWVRDREKPNSFNLKSKTLLFSIISKLEIQH